MEIGLIVLLVAALIYMHTINQKLKMLKSGGDGFKAVVVELSHATENAKTAIQGLKLTVRDAEHGLDGNLKQARSISEELRYLIEQASGHSGNLQQNPRNVPQPSQNLKNVRAPIVPQNRAKNFADQTLEKVAKRNESLPNPIIHSHEAKVADEQNLGLNIPSEHREMALERREQALRSIAAKNNNQNRRAAPAAQQNRQAPLQATRPMPGQRAPDRSSERPAERPNERPVNARRPQAVSRPQSRPSALPEAIRNSRAPDPNLNVGAIPPAQKPRDGMSLSDMVGRHAEIERQNFETPNSDVEAAPNDANQNANNVEATDKRQSLFQKLSRTR